MQNGIDISKWQPGNTPELVPCDFVFVKATGGIGYVNEQLQQQVASARRAGKPLGAYHFARDGWTGTTADQEAAWFLKHVPAGAMPVLDWEADNVHDLGWAARWLNTVTEALGIAPLIYMNLSVASKFDWSGIAPHHQLWLALYGADQQTIGYQAKPPPTVPHWGTPSILQYTQKGRLPGYGGDLDLNIMYRDVFGADGDLINGVGELGA